MRLKKIQEALKTKNIIFTYTEEDNCGSLDFQFRGLRYHIWEFADDVEPVGVEAIIPSPENAVTSLPSLNASSFTTLTEARTTASLRALPS